MGRYVVETRGGGKKTHKTVTTVTEHFWRFAAEWTLEAFEVRDSVMVSNTTVVRP